MHPPDAASEGHDPEVHEAGLQPRFTCRYCGHEHRAVALKPYQKALCTRCGLALAKGTRFGSDSTVALIITAVIVAVPAFFLPFVTVSKLGSGRTGHLLAGARALWMEDMQLLSIWVALCACIAPFLMLASLAVLTLPPRFGQRWPWTGWLRRAAIAMEEWSMPEVYVLAVLVALTKLGSLVDVKIEPGFWCYATMSLLLLLSWRNFRLGPPPFSSPERAQSSP
jgi:paraquat-inducible protein A